jgi:hypothetical protein
MRFASTRGVESVRFATVVLAAAASLLSFDAYASPRGGNRSGVAWHASADSRQLAGVESPVADPRSSGRDGRIAAPVDPVSAVEPRRWKALLVSGSRSTSAYDAAAFDLAQRLRARGAARVATALTGDRGDFNASRAGINQALEWLGNEHGACLFFATGHSNVTGFHLDAESGRRTLTPGELARLLDKHCGDRPTVVIISGCDAGVFLDSRMRQPNRVLIAASARGRDSYGARLDDRHVNFDRCFLGAIDAGAATWREAFQRTLPCVQEREAWLGVRASEPQSYFGAAVVDLAIPGAARLMARMR